MYGDARISMTDGRQLTVTEYMQYLRAQGPIREVTSSIPDESWRDDLKAVTDGGYDRDEDEE